jgi:hypothetical protein
VYFNNATIRTVEGRSEIVLTGSTTVANTTSSTNWTKLNEMSIKTTSNGTIGKDGY